jgi:hypothetical protein
MRLKNWDYRELRERIADGITLRRFTDCCLANSFKSKSTATNPIPIP